MEAGMGYIFFYFRYSLAIIFPFYISKFLKLHFNLITIPYL